MLRADSSISVVFPDTPHVQHKAIVAEDAETVCLRSPAHSHHQVLGLCLRGLQIRYVAGQTVNDLGVPVTRAEPNGLNFEDHGKGSTALSFTEAYTMHPDLDGRAVEAVSAEHRMEALKAVQERRRRPTAQQAVGEAAS